MNPERNGDLRTQRGRRRHDRRSGGERRQAFLPFAANETASVTMSHSDVPPQKLYEIQNLVRWGAIEI